jgi:tetratricopeptide (TPR) repeat protein
VEKGIKYLQRAIEEDPGYAPAYAALAEAYYALSNMQLNPREAMTQAKEAAIKALEMNSTLAEAHAALGVVKAFYEWDWRGAEVEFKRALEFDPAWAGAQGWYGAYLALMGRLDESKAELERARRLDPLSLSINSTMGLPLYLAGQYDQVIDQMRKTLELDPNFYMAHISLGLVYESKGEPDSAIAEFQKARQLDDSPEILAYLGRTYALAGRRREAEKVIAELQEISKKRYVSPYDIAIIYAGLGQKDQALEWLRKAYESRAEGMCNLKTDPRLNDLRSDPRFQELLRLMNFPP